MALSDEECQWVRLTLATNGWERVMRPRLEIRGRAAIKALTLSPTERGTQYKGTDFDTDDNVLRAMIRDVEWMIAVWQNELTVAEHNRRIDELGRQNANSPVTNSP